MEFLISKYQKAPVEEYPNNVTERPLVSVCVQTYNHVDYIKECIEGILIQKTDCPVEILLGEDESNDGTRETCLDYAKRYPEKIRLFLHSRKNNIIINGNPTGKFTFFYNLSKARGKYIALCDGDDYWTDPFKLQKQVEFLEANEDYVMCFHSFNRVRENKLVLNKKQHKPSYTLVDLARMFSLGIQTTTVLYRKSAFKPLNYQLSGRVVGSHFLFLQLAESGKIKYFAEPMSVYRVHSEGIFSGKTKTNQVLMALQNIEAMIAYFQNKPEVVFLLKRKYVYRCIKTSATFLKQRKLSNSMLFFKKSFSYGVYNWFILVFSIIANPK